MIGVVVGWVQWLDGQQFPNLTPSTPRDKPWSEGFTEKHLFIEGI